jgi:hypothetical protein
MSAMAVVWRFIFDTNIGVLNEMARTLGRPGCPGCRTTAWRWRPAILIGVEQHGYAMVLFLAGLTTISATVRSGGDRRRRHPSSSAPSPALLVSGDTFVVVILTLRPCRHSIPSRCSPTGPARRDAGPVSPLFQVGFQYFDTGFASSISVVSSRSWPV